uniref:GHMP kinase C-terminal domain-containing protein n=1 Tax=Phenylobacterium glaciei TaxID=2803784 RepID=A0A974S9U0_9CAUL|nr:hypothetical protein JKL49_24995 [Phenylobacterium glaciei]
MRAQAPASLQALHDIKASAYAMREALLAGDLARFGDLLDSGWASKKLTATKMSSAQIDEVYARAKAFGAFGARSRRRRRLHDVPDRPHQTRWSQTPAEQFRRRG